MGIVQKLTAKSWSAENSASDDQHLSAISPHSSKIGLRLFLAIVTSLFFLVAAAYKMRMDLADWVPMPEPDLLWYNTVILLASSFAMEWARRAAKRGQAQTVKLGMIIGGVLAITFLVGQLVAWQEMADLGFYASSNPANSFFYMITGIHGLHILGGVIAWTRSMARIGRGDDADKIKLGVDLCATYWHFLLLVWLVMFALMIST